MIIRANGLFPVESVAGRGSNAVRLTVGTVPENVSLLVYFATDFGEVLPAINGKLESGTVYHLSQERSTFCFVKATGLLAGQSIAIDESYSPKGNGSREVKVLELVSRPPAALVSLIYPVDLEESLLSVSEVSNVDLLDRVNNLEDTCNMVTGMGSIVLRATTIKASAEDEPVSLDTGITDIILKTLTIRPETPEDVAQLDAAMTSMTLQRVTIRTEHEPDTLNAEFAATEIRLTNA